MSKITAFLLFSLPLFYFIYDVVFLAPVDIVADIYIITGVGAFIMLFITIIISRIKALKKFMRYRRMAGLFTLFYAFLHFLNFFVFDMSLDVTSSMNESLEKPFILFGMLAFIIFIGLGITSTKKLFRRHKKWHILVYIAAIASLAHFVMIQKIVTFYDYFIIIPISLLLLIKIISMAIIKKSKKKV